MLDMSVIGEEEVDSCNQMMMENEVDEVDEEVDFCNQIMMTLLLLLLDQTEISPKTLNCVAC